MMYVDTIELPTERPTRECDDCGTTTGHHANTCEFFGLGTWCDEYVPEDERVYDLEDTYAYLDQLIVRG